MKTELEERASVIEPTLLRMIEALPVYIPLTPSAISGLMSIARFEQEKFDALTAQLTEAEREKEVLVGALKRIRDMDYRGNRHSSADIAQAALEAVKEEAGESSGS